MLVLRISDTEGGDVGRHLRNSVISMLVAIGGLVAAPAGAADNLATNPSFETCSGCVTNAGALPDGWIGYGPGPRAGTNVHWTTDAARTGTAAVRIDDRRFFATGLASNSVPVTPGEVYTASVWIKQAPLAEATTT